MQKTRKRTDSEESVLCKMRRQQSRTLCRLPSAGQLQGDASQNKKTAAIDSPQPFFCASRWAWSPGRGAHTPISIPVGLLACVSSEPPFSLLRINPMTDFHHEKRFSTLTAPVARGLAPHFLFKLSGRHALPKSHWNCSVIFSTATIKHSGSNVKFFLQNQDFLWSFSLFPCASTT